MIYSSVRTHAGVARWIFSVALVAVLLFHISLSAQTPPREQVVDPAFAGDFTAERASLHNLILNSFIGGHHAVRSPRVLFVSGAFASGKTSAVMRAVAQQGLDPASTVVVDSDVMRALLPEWTDLAKADSARAVETTNRESGYLAERLFWLAMSKNFNVVFVSAHRDRDFTKKLLETLRSRYPTRIDRMEWIHVENSTRVLRERVAARNGTDPRKTDTDRAFRSVIQSRDTFRSLLPILPRALEVDMSSGAVQVTSVYDGKKTTSVNGMLDPDLRTVKANPTRAGYDVVVDLDWTLLSPIPEDQRKGRTDLIRFGAETYAVAPAALDTIVDWISRGDIRVHIFSGGERDRNRSVLSQLRTPFGNSLLDLIESRGGNVWSREDLSPSREEGGIADRFKKRVEGLLPNVEPSRLIGIDDQSRFGDGWLKMIPSFGFYNDRISYDPSKSGLVYEPASHNHWQSERLRWYALHALMMGAIESDKAGKTSFRDSLLRNTRLLSFGTPEWARYVDRGQKQMKISTELKMCRALFVAN